MKICLIGKYPPIEGGASSKVYWLAKALGEKGHEIHVVTNAGEVEKNYREEIDADDLDSDYQPKNVFVHSTDSSGDLRHIPYTNPYLAKLATLAINVIKEYNLQLIDSWYILPYAISGFLAKVVTGRPQIMRHEGSDIGRLLELPHFKTLFLSLFERVDKIITYPNSMEKLLSLGIAESKLFCNRVSIDTKAFNPKVRPLDLSKYTNRRVIDSLPVITYIGKISAVKGIYELVEAASKIKKDFLLLFVSQGSGLGWIKRYIRDKGLARKTLFINFLPPWKIPSIIKRSDCVIMLERDSPIVQHKPILFREVMAVGKCLVLSSELYNKLNFPYLSEGRDLIVVNSREIHALRETIERIIKVPIYAKKIGRHARLVSVRVERFDEYVNDNIHLYEELLKSHKRQSEYERKKL